MAPLALRTYPIGVCNCNCNCIGGVVTDEAIWQKCHVHRHSSYMSREAINVVYSIFGDREKMAAGCNAKKGMQGARQGAHPKQGAWATARNGPPAAPLVQQHIQVSPAGCLLADSHRSNIGTWPMPSKPRWSERWGPRTCSAMYLCTHSLSVLQQKVRHMSAPMHETELPGSSRVPNCSHRANTLGVCAHAMRGSTGSAARPPPEPVLKYGTHAQVPHPQPSLVGHGHHSQTGVQTHSAIMCCSRHQPPTSLAHMPTTRTSLSLPPRNVTPQAHPYGHRQHTGGLSLTCNGHSTHLHSTEPPQSQLVTARQQGGAGPRAA